ncbi:sugar phosphate nucleotidyltransferase, partial [Salmonella enterica subsp. enterica serovar Typhimurium]|nr:sugar phosphate nucleotidyltransferase [Salmonella enterica subsp. enterica serovar Typhimurium]
GTADSVYQNLHLLDRVRPDLVLVFGADHIYRMDIRQMARHHLETGADATVAALPVPVENSASFGIIRTDSTGRIRDFQEKPATAES